MKYLKLKYDSFHWTPALPSQRLILGFILFFSAIFMLIGFLIFGIKQDGLNWSFAITVIAAILTVVAGALAVVQMRQSGVRV